MVPAPNKGKNAIWPISAFKKYIISTQFDEYKDLLTVEDSIKKLMNQKAHSEDEQHVFLMKNLKEHIVSGHTEKSKYSKKIFIEGQISNISIHDR